MKENSTEALINSIKEQLHKDYSIDLESGGAHGHEQHINIFDKPFNAFFDHTLLKPAATQSAIDVLCDEAREYTVASVCVPPNRVQQAYKALQNSPVAVCTVIGFPCGYTVSSIKVAEVEVLKAHGCTEFDTVIPIGALIEREFLAVYEDIRAVVIAARPHLVKVILETALLTREQIIQGGILAVAAGAAYLKTSTGFASEGATIDNIMLLSAVGGERVGVKAAGGIKTLAFAQQCITAGADRLGCSQSVALIKERAE